MSTNQSVSEEVAAKASINAVLDLLLDAICCVNRDGIFIYASAGATPIFGYTPDELVGKNMLDIMHPDDRDRTLALVDDIMAGQPRTGIENRYIRKDGEIVYIMWSARWSEADQCRIAVARDITQRKRAEALNKALYAISEATHVAGDLDVLFERIHSIIGELLPAGNFFIALYDENADKLSFPYYVDECDEAPAPRALDTGTLTAEVIRSGQTLFLTPENVDSLPHHLQNVIGTEARYWLGVPLQSNNHRMGALVVQIYDVGKRYTERDRDLLQFVSAQVAAAIERNRMYANLQYLAQYDHLTGLPNRLLLSDRIKTAINRARRRGHLVAVLYCDLDNFKGVNDTFGHATGDLLLQEAAGRLSGTVRESDTVSRIGGDEFVIVLDAVNDISQSMQVVEKIIAGFDESFHVAGQRLRVRPSIGVAHYPMDGKDEKQLLLQADAAMYRDKHSAGVLPQNRRAEPG
jgi:diguanylate cyclase (GGDEF)-like protein/PAS domain S-box-containing protein